jgi:hypothetical protein
MEYIYKYFQCYKNKELTQIKKDLDDIKKKIGIQENPIHIKIERINDLDKKIDDNNIDILTKILYLKEEMQKLDSKIKELELNLTSKDNYCIIDNRLGGSTSEDNDSSDESPVPQQSVVV